MATFGGVDLTTLGTKRPRAPLEVHDAVRRCDAPRLKQLLESGAALTEVDDSGCTPMHLAVQLGSDFALAMMTILLSVDEDERADALVALADDGLSPYHLCARTGQPKLMAVLLDSVDDDMREDVLEMRTHLRGELWNGNWGKKAADGELEELDVEHMTLLHLAPHECYAQSRVERGSRGPAVLSRVPLGAGATRSQGGRRRRPGPADRRRARRGRRAKLARGLGERASRGGREGGSRV